MRTFVVIDRLRNVPGLRCECGGKRGTYQFNDTDIAFLFPNQVITGSISGGDLRTVEPPEVCT